MSFYEGERLGRVTFDNIFTGRKRTKKGSIGLLLSSRKTPLSLLPLSWHNGSAEIRLDSLAKA